MKDVRIKVLPGNFLDSIGINVFMIENNISEYDAYIKGNITRFNHFVEFQGGRAAGFPDMKGELNYRGNKFKFQACNIIFRRPVFDIAGKDDKMIEWSMSEGDSVKAKIDGVNFLIKRLENGDGAILFELYVDCMFDGEPAPPSTVHRRETIESL